MHRLKFKLSTLLLLFTFFAVTIGLGYQVLLLRQRTVELEAEVLVLKQRSEKLAELLAIKESGLSPFRQRNPYGGIHTEREFARYGIR